MNGAQRAQRVRGLIFLMNPREKYNEPTYFPSFLFFRHWMLRHHLRMLVAGWSKI